MITVNDEEGNGGIGGCPGPFLLVFMHWSVTGLIGGLHGPVRRPAPGGKNMAIVGIGIDMAQIAEISRLSEVMGPSFFQRTFTDIERTEAERRRTREAKLEYYAARYAVKEAVFKALAPHIPEKGFDFRHVCTLNHEDGSPYVEMTEWMRNLCREAGASKIHVSITTEGEYAAAFVIAEG